MTNQAAAKSKDASSDQAFAAGDLGRVQGLLFGDQFDAMNARIDSLEAMLLDSVAAVRSEMRKEVAGTGKKIDRTKAQIDKRIDTKIEKESTARKTAFVEISETANTETADLRIELDQKSAAFEKSLDSLKAATEKAVASTRTSLEKKIERSEQTLTSQKVDCNALAEMLSQTAAQLTDEKKTGPQQIERAA